MDLNETSSIIDEANEATKVLKSEFNTLINEVTIPIEKEENELNGSIITIIGINTNTVLNNTSLIINEETIDLNKTIDINNTTPLIHNQIFELNESIELNSSIIEELNTSKNMSCKENNITFKIDDSHISDDNNSIVDNGCTDTEIEGKSIRGLIIYRTEIKPYCSMTGDAFAKQYMQEDWDDIYLDKEFKMEILKACPKIKNIYKDKWTPHLYQFTIEYASDSDAIPEC
jgi:hypothetical protein